MVNRANVIVGMVGCVYEACTVIMKTKHLFYITYVLLPHLMPSREASRPSEEAQPYINNASACTMKTQLCAGD